MKRAITKLGEDGIKVMLMAAAGVTSTAIVFLAGMFTESHIVTRELFANIEPGIVHQKVAIAQTSKGAR